METCRYCNEDITGDEDTTDEDALLEHFVEEHDTELSRIDTKRVEKSDAVSFPTEPTQTELLIQTGILLAGAGLSFAALYSIYYFIGL